MPITNLTGTTWTFNPQVDKLSVGTIFKINGVASSGDLSLNVRSIQFDINSSGNVYFARLSTQSSFSADGPVFQHSTYWMQWPDAVSGLADPVTLTITDGEDVTNADLIAWLEVNATLIGSETPDTPNTTITYDGDTIASVVSGGTATLRCAGKKMKTDITIKAAEGGVNLPNYDGTITVDEEVIPLELALQEKTVTENCEIIPDAGYNGFSRVIVNVADKDIEEYDGRMVIV